MSAAGEDRLPTLDGWRAVAISLVLVFHISANPTNQVMFFVSHSTLGTLGVHLFFGLSGFLVTTRLLGEWKVLGRTPLGPFYVRRVFRILPPVLSYLGVLGLLGGLGFIVLYPSELKSCLLLYRNYSRGTLLTAHFWSLMVEEHFYLLFPACLVLIPNPWRVAVLTGAGLLVTAWRIVESRVRLIGPEWGSNWYQRTDVKLDTLLLGAALAVYLFHPENRDQARQFLRRWRYVWLFVTLAAAYPLQNIATGIFKTAFIPFLIATTALNPDLQWSRFLEHPWVAWVGRVSYGTYVWNQLWFFLPSPWPRVPTPLALALTYACVVASYYVLEKPLLRVGRKLAARLRNPSRAPVSLGAP